MLNVNRRCVVIRCGAGGLVVLVDTMHCAHNFVFCCLFLSVSLFLLLFSPPFARGIQNTSSHGRLWGSVSSLAHWLTAGFNWRLWAQITKAIYQHFVHVCVCVPVTTPASACCMSKRRGASAERTVWREPCGVCVCVRIAQTRNKLISTICSQFRDELPIRRSCSRWCQFFLDSFQFFFVPPSLSSSSSVANDTACCSSARYHDTFESINFELLLLPSA